METTGRYGAAIGTIVNQTIKIPLPKYDSYTAIFVIPKISREY